MNILFSSTRQWNPGDEFIFFGIRNIIEELFNDKKINWVLYDRNPDLFVSPMHPYHKDNILGNSFHRGVAEIFDLAIVAGSPEWFGSPLQNFYKVVAESKINLAVLGAGYINKPINFSEVEKECFNDYAKIITVRDKNAGTALDAVSVSYELLPCPALFASRKEFPVTRIKKIGFILQTDRTINQAVSTEMKHACIHAVKAFKDLGVDVDVICNYIDEFMEFADSLAPIRYSYDAADYISILGDYDLIISTRLHGAVLANSLGKPAILVNAMDSRLKGGSAEFPYIYMMHPDSIVEECLRIDPKCSNDILDWKTKIKEQYLDLLRRKLNM